MGLKRGLGNKVPGPFVPFATLSRLVPGMRHAAAFEGRDYNVLCIKNWDESIDSSMNLSINSSTIRILGSLNALKFLRLLEHRSCVYECVYIHMFEPRGTPGRLTSGWPKKGRIVTFKQHVGLKKGTRRQSSLLL